MRGVPWLSAVLTSIDSSDITSNIQHHADFTPLFSPEHASPLMAYHATARSVFDSLIMNWNATYDYHNKVNAKQAYYLSMEFFADCSNVQSLACNYCDRISEHGLKTVLGLSNMTSLSLKKCAAFTGLRKLETLNMRYCNGITDSDMKYLSDCSNVQSLAFNYCGRISEHGLKTVSGLSNMTSLSLKKCAAFTGLRKLETLDMRYCNGITDSDMKYLSGYNSSMTL
ncbi:plastid starch phosphorylase [Hordeum vulgare]|nr:plastid starch phosphorylase [Hordeum vulgare]